jgi:hypothetical protein
MPDIPQAAYQNTIRALDEFDAVATMYASLLDTQRALLRSENAIAAGRLSFRGDGLARQATAYGQQIASMRTAIATARYEGAKTRELYQRFRATEQRAQELGASANQLAKLCLVQRNAAAAALDRDRGPAQHRTRAHDSYVTTRRGLIIDTSW